MITFTADTILQTRKWFADNAKGCIAEVKSGAVRVNDPDEYFAKCEADVVRALNGGFDHTVTFRQRAHFIQTGECVAILP